MKTPSTFSSTCCKALLRRALPSSFQQDSQSLILPDELLAVSTQSSHADRVWNYRTQRKKRDLVRSESVALSSYSPSGARFLSTSPSVKLKHTYAGAAGSTSIERRGGGTCIDSHSSVPLIPGQKTEFSPGAMGAPPDASTLPHGEAEMRDIFVRGMSTNGQSPSPSPAMTTVNANEVRHFNQLSGEWWDLNGSLGALHDFNPHRVGFIKSSLQKLCFFQAILRRRSLQGPGTTESAGKLPARDIKNTRTLTQQRGNLAQGTEGGGAQSEMEEPQVGDTRGVLDGVRILDIGCGGGILSEAMARDGAFVTGLDAATEAITAAEARRLNGPYAPVVRDRQRFIHGSLEDFCSGKIQQTLEGPQSSFFPNHQQSLFDVVVCSEVLEHVDGGLEGVEAVIATAARQALAPGGLFVLSTLNRTPENYLVSIVAAEHLCGIVPKGTHDWNKFLKPDELREIGERHGLRLMEQRGFFYVPFLRTFVREPFCRFSFAMAFEKI
ncbi:3-demethylubiquinone-9 3-O-methyltransferase [Toxoplasma gondii VAND]|uniref:Ubiquinone biosynthesis O-methyltransferase, mitochondrial n=4 Tax=Toxoplasma gondii TaxID=5811 RepID=A0A086QMF7_TOXGO|nr:3-demethylubiquinone-9 3-O-methyltransferase [Toxoplasma gondii p89]KFH01812.1 3-demethylubiquinone-9 3-O-methyltransferase [Toxoplasma gondii VAND]KFH13789.1 3-demethylubiquinone-9 3-O-methyltransferase [Toxoplasma gondii MAS]PUA85529.1 3-demethylubiquinone-9 3-O-methyltransferase [Toxoplasma gondii TgCATBr9]